MSKHKKEAGSSQDMDKAILYHANCYDGFGAAWAAWKKFGAKALYQSVQYGEDPPAFSEPRAIYLLDFIFPREVIEELRSKGNRVVVIDHHKSAMNALDGLPDTVFDMEKAASVLAWEHFFPDAEVPELLQYVQDYDLWKFDLPLSKEVSIALTTYPMEFSVWDGLDTDALARDGRPLLRLQHEMVQQMCDQATLVRFDAYEVPVVNVSAFSSEVGEELLKRFQQAPFSVSYHDRADGQRHWSLRSRPDFDVSVLAKKYGGGGHRQAAGFETPLTPSELAPELPTPETG
jgi:oligoribonuclease NrnB/cAMP/cGMP phosphodiesterase (DHH superfamily)